MAITYCLLRGKVDAVCVQVFQEGSVNRIWKFTHFYNIILTVFQRRTKMFTPEGRKACQVLSSGQEQTTAGAQMGKKLTGRKRKSSTTCDTLQASHLRVFALASRCAGQFPNPINSTRLLCWTCPCGHARWKLPPPWRSSHTTSIERHLWKPCGFIFIISE